METLSIGGKLLLTTINGPVNGDLYLNGLDSVSTDVVNNSAMRMGMFIFIALTLFGAAIILYSIKKSLTEDITLPISKKSFTVYKPTSLRREQMKKSISKTTSHIDLEVVELLVNLSDSEIYSNSLFEFQLTIIDLYAVDSSKLEYFFLDNYDSVVGDLTTLNEQSNLMLNKFNSKTVGNYMLAKKDMAMISDSIYSNLSKSLINYTPRESKEVY